MSAIPSPYTVQTPGLDVPESVESQEVPLALPWLVPEVTVEST
jgi:hypothetical protein